MSHNRMGVESILKSIKSQGTQLEKIVEELLWSAEQTQSILAELESNPGAVDQTQELEDHKEKLRASMKTVIARLIKLELYSEHVNKRSQFSGTPEERIAKITELSDQLGAEIRNISNPTDDDITNHVLYGRFLKKLKEQKPTGGGDDDDVDLELMPTDEEFPTTCPVTRMAITNPVILPCGHVFDREGVNLSMRGHAPYSCPQIGCPNSFNRNDVKVYAAMKNKLARDKELGN